MSLPRELRVKDGRLVQTPIAGVEALRDQALPADGTLPKAGELEIRVPDGDFDLALYCKEDGTGGLRLHYDAQARVCTVDRRGMDKRFNPQVFEVLDVPMDAPLTSLRIFIDRSSTEIFFNGGEKTFTTHSYPTEGERFCRVSEGAELKLWSYKTSVTDEFVV